MLYEISEIMRDVRIVLDQNTSSEALLTEGDVDTLTLDEIIESRICEGIQRIETIASPQFLDEGYVFADDQMSIYWGKNESGFIVLPEDFMRLIAFKMSDWEQTVYSAIPPTDPIYLKQSSRYKGIRGNTQKPVCAIVSRPEGKSLEFYSCKSQEAYPSIALYRPYPKIDNRGKYKYIDISEKCYIAVVYAIASLVLAIYGATDKSSSLAELSKTMVQ